MEGIKEMFRRMAYLLTRDRRSRELEAEMAFHREMAERNGSTDHRRKFGNPARLQEQAREAWGWTWIDRLFQDLRFATRMLARSPGFTLAAVLVLAIGVGVNVAAFSIFNLVALKSMPIRDPDSLLTLQRRSPDQIAGGMPYPTAIFYRDHAKTLSAVLTILGARMELDNDAQPVRTNFVSTNWFKDLGFTAPYGRLLEPSIDEAPSAPPVAILSHEFWQSHFGADPTIVGKVVHLNHKPVAVIGILPYGFPELSGARGDVWLQIQAHPYFFEGSKVLTDMGNGPQVFGRLSPGSTARMAEQELLQLTNELREQYPKDIWKDQFVHTDPGAHQMVMQTPMYAAAAVVGALTLLILAVACANLGGLLLARGASREHELGIRLAIGASRWRLFRQLFTESLLLAFLGSAVGLLLGYLAIRITLAATDAPEWMSAAPDWRVILFVMGLAFVASLFFGFAPALQMARQKHKKTLARQILVGAQVAASCVLLIVASLLVRAVQHALYTSPGFGYEQVISIDPKLGEHDYKPGAAKAYLDQLQARVRSLPGVVSVALVKLPPLGHGITRMDTEVNGHPLQIFPNWVDPEFFRTMDVPILLGRNFIPGEKHVVLVSQSMARRMWPGENPIGKTYGDKDTVIGVVGNARMHALHDDDTVELYWPVQPEDMAGMCLVLKTSGAPDGLTVALKAIVQNLDPKLFPEISLLKANFRSEMKSIEIAALVVSLVGMLAMLLAGIGILGLVAYTVSQRTREIAIRIALGANPVQVLSSVLRQFRWPVLIGVIAGIAGTAALSQILRRILYGVSNLDPLSYVAAVAILLAIFVVAALLPARRALKLDVARALHQE